MVFNSLALSWHAEESETVTSSWIFIKHQAVAWSSVYRQYTLSYSTLLLISDKFI